MDIEKARTLKHGATVSIIGKGNGHEPAITYEVTVRGTYHQRTPTCHTHTGIPYVWVHTDVGVWASTRLN